MRVGGGSSGRYPGSATGCERRSSGAVGGAHGLEHRPPVGIAECSEAKPHTPRDPTAALTSPWPATINTGCALPGDAGDRSALRRRHTLYARSIRLFHIPAPGGKKRARITSMDVEEDARVLRCIPRELPMPQPVPKPAARPAARPTDTLSSGSDAAAGRFVRR